MKILFPTDRTPLIRGLILFCFISIMAEFMIFAQWSLAGDDGMEMVLIKKGTFDMGSQGEEYPDDERPRHEVKLDSYSIDKYEVTNEMFVKFLNAVRPEEGAGNKRWQWIVIRNDLSTTERGDWFPSEIRFESGKYVAVKGFEHYPVLSVSWYAAEEYCKDCPRRPNGKKRRGEGLREWISRGETICRPLTVVSCSGGRGRITRFRLLSMISGITPLMVTVSSIWRGARLSGAATGTILNITGHLPLKGRKARDRASTRS